MKRRLLLRSVSAMLAFSACAPAFAAQHITLRNGSEFDCIRQEPAGAHVRLYLFSTSIPGAPATGDANYIEVPADSVLRAEAVPDPTLVPAAAPALATLRTVSLSLAEMRQMLARAGAAHNIDADLLASVIQAESNGNTFAVSRAGAQGLMQLMPSTASDLGVHNAFAPEQNIGGGTAYLDQLLIRYRDNIALALAAYNAGPAAVDRYHGIPPFAETRAYVARVIRTFNRRKLASAANLGLTANAR